MGTKEQGVRMYEENMGTPKPAEKVATAWDPWGVTPNRTIADEPDWQPMQGAAEDHSRMPILKELGVPATEAVLKHWEETRNRGDWRPYTTINPEPDEKA